MSPRSRRRVLAAILLCLFAVSVPATEASSPTRCRDFVRFTEHWERCVAPDGAVEIHRVGVLFDA